MRRIASWVLIVGSLCGGGLCEVSAVFSSYYSDKRYDFRINPEQLANTPAWLVALSYCKQAIKTGLAARF